MSWLRRLEAELVARDVRPRVRARILAEYADHLACEPAAEQRLGDPAALATSFADELAADDARRLVGSTFLALVPAAVAFAASQLTSGSAGGPPGIDHGASLLLTVPAVLAMVVGPQAALVAWGLAAARVVRRRHATVLPAAELALLRRRCAVALGAGLVTTLGLLVCVAAFSGVMATWWLVLVGALSAGAAAAVGAGAALVRARPLRAGTPGPAGDLRDDLPAAILGPVAQRAALLAIAGTALAVTAIGAQAESSIAEGLQRGAFEAIAATAGFALFGRALGVRAARGGA